MRLKSCTKLGLMVTVVTLTLILVSLFVKA